MTITPDDLRALADGLANQNSEAERVAARYAASADMLDALKSLLTDIEGFFASPDHLEMALDLARAGAPIITPDAAPKNIRAARAAIAKAERAEP